MSRHPSTPVWKRAVGFLRSVREEPAKVNWPSRRELVTYSMVVVVTVVLIGAFVYALDYGFSDMASRLFVHTMGPSAT
jgi:preprotein translocase subunit SecE